MAVMDKEEIATIEAIFNYCSETVEPAKANFEAFRTEYEKSLKDLSNSEFKRCAQMFNDSIHGPVEVNSLELAIINTPEFFRLKEIKQLGGKFHVYPGAIHTRFEHSIGVCHLAGELLDHLKKQLVDAKENGITAQEEKCVRLAGLCHDLGHGPFSHLFESVARRILERDNLHHEDLSVLIFKKILLDNPVVVARFVRQCDMKLEHVLAIERMIVPKLDEIDKEKKFLYEIVANKQSGMDVDKWDYFARDFLHLGVTNEFDWRRTMKLSAIVKCEGEYHLGFRNKEIENVYGMFRTRSILYLKALRHKTVQAIEMMIEDILYEAKDVKMLDTSGTAESLYDPISVKKALQDAYDERPAKLKGYLALTDNLMPLIMYSMPEDKKSEGLKKARNLIMRLKTRELYRMIMERTIPLKEKRTFQEFLRKINQSDKMDVKLVCFKFASEENPEPTEEMYFFPKSKDSCIPDIPERRKNERLIQGVSSLCKPEKYVEFRVRMYWKTKPSKVEEDEVKRKFDEDLEKYFTAVVSLDYIHD